MKTINLNNTKKVSINLLSMMMVCAVLFLSSCDKDDEEPTPNNTIKNGELAHVDITGKETLKAGTQYTLKDGPLVVKAGGELTIPAGTVIKCEGGTKSYIVVEMGGKIFVNGTKANPVVMTSSKANPQPQDWGGFIVCGKGITNKGQNATTEVAGFNYGGTNANDNSGVISYLRVEYTGAVINSDAEFNGITFYAVGSATQINNISSVAGSDDGVEFFGGNVDAQNIYIEDADDDGLDFADGYTGTIKNVYIKGVKKAGIEGSNNGEDGNATPVTTATIENVTILDGGLGMSEGAIYFKEGGGKLTYKNIYVKEANLGVKVKDSDMAAKTRLENGDLMINPIQFDASVSDFKLGVSNEYVTQKDNQGAGNKADLPDWAMGWATK